MIRVDRNAVPRPQIFDQGGAAEKERTDAEAHFAPGGPGGPDGQGEKFKFGVYSHQTIKDALEALFHGKCAYCEGKYAGTQPMDVEHWRPKAKVVEDGQSFGGYYWLAADWHNLLPSCIDCNRKRKQIVGPEGEKRAVGKANRFPIAGVRVSSHTQHGDLGGEQPLLLHPCVDTPKDHLDFVDEGVVAARSDEAGVPSAKGEASIEVYALNRSGLVHGRREVQLLLEDRFFSIRRLTEVLDRIVDDDEHEEIRNLLEDLLAYEMTALCRFTEPTQPYSAMAQQKVDAFVDELFGE